MTTITKEQAVQLAQPEPPCDENITDAWISASDSDGIAYDGPSFERGYRLGRGEYDEYTGSLVADTFKRGRNSGLEEAKQVCEKANHDELASFSIYEPGSTERRAWNEGTISCAATIESLKDNTAQGEQQEQKGNV